MTINFRFLGHYVEFEDIRELLLLCRLQYIGGGVRVGSVEVPSSQTVARDCGCLSHLINNHSIINYCVSLMHRVVLLLILRYS